jgi:uncharacterized protein
MRFVLVGATGFIGSKILAEAVGRGHLVTALCRHPENVLKHPNVQARFADVMDTAALQRLFSGHDAIVHPYAPPFDLKVRAQYVAKVTSEGRMAREAFASYRPTDPVAHEVDVRLRIVAQTQATQSIIRAAQGAGIKRILAVGGAGSLLVDGVLNMDRPEISGGLRGRSEIHRCC